jgi:hypothetical protein
LHLWGVAPRVRRDSTFVLNELVSDVVEHAGTVGEVHVRYDGDVVAVRVIDFSPQVPQQTTATGSPLRSGLDVVDVMSRDWGYVVVPGGKTVWAVVDGRPEQRS